MPKSDSPTHIAVVEAGSRLAQLVHSTMGAHVIEITVNSTHHQAVDIPGDGLRIVARSPQDGVIEALESTADDHFVMGVQWHPERMWQNDPASQEMFRALVEEARKWHESRAAQSRDFETLKR